MLGIDQRARLAVTLDDTNRLRHAIESGRQVDRPLQVIDAIDVGAPQSLRLDTVRAQRRVTTILSGVSIQATVHTRHVLKRQLHVHLIAQRGEMKVAIAHVDLQVADAAMSE